MDKEFVPASFENHLYGHNQYINNQYGQGNDPQNPGLVINDPQAYRAQSPTNQMGLLQNPPYQNPNQPGRGIQVIPPSQNQGYVPPNLYNQQSPIIQTGQPQQRVQLRPGEVVSPKNSCPLNNQIQQYTLRMIQIKNLEHKLQNEFACYTFICWFWMILAIAYAVVIIMNPNFDDGVDLGLTIVYSLVAFMTCKVGLEGLSQMNLVKMHITLSNLRLFFLIVLARTIVVIALRQYFYLYSVGTGACIGFIFGVIIYNHGMKIIRVLENRQALLNPLIEPPRP